MMYDLLNFTEQVGAWSISEFWFPVLVWTVFAAVTILLLRHLKQLNPLYHFHLRVAVLLALPAGLMTILSSSAFREIFYPAPDAVAGAFFVVQSPLDLSVSASEAASATNWLNPSLAAGFFFLIAAGISLFLILRLIISYIKLNRFRKDLPVIDLISCENLSKHNKALLHKFGKNVTLAFGSDDFSPFTFGWKNPVIVVPETFKKEPHKLNMIIGHELIHIRRGDYQLHLLQSVIRALFGFHPLVHIISRQTENYREISCDQEVLYETRISPKSYAGLLVNLLPFSAKDVSPSIAMAVSNSNIKTRIETMNTYKIHKTSYTRSFVFLLMLTVGIILPIACSDLQTTESENIATPEDLQQQKSQASINNSDDALWVVNGEILSEQDHKNFSTLIKPEEIQSISVLKNESAIEKYGEKGQYGVIEIQLKAPVSLNKPAADGKDFFVVVEEQPELIGGIQSILSRVEYPELARRAGIEGRVIVQFIVDETGNVVNPTVIRGIGGGCDEAALEAVKQAKFKPGKQKGRAVRVQYSLPVTFKLSQ